MVKEISSRLNSVWFSRILLVLALLLLALRFVHLGADPLNHSFWSDDNAKYSDEGWWSNAGQYSVNEGSIHPQYEWMPASAVPVWPLLTAALFHWTGISLVAARAMEVFFSLGALLFAVLAVRRLAGTQHALWVALLAAASGATFFFARLALLEQPLLFFGFLALWLIVISKKNSWLAPAAAGVACALMILSKTTGVFLTPAILYPAFFNFRKDWKTAARIAVVLLVVLFTVLDLETHFFASHYVMERALFFASSMPHLSFKVIAEKLARLFLRGIWADAVFWPLALVAAAASLIWMRNLWTKPLWGISVAWVVGYSTFIVYHVDGPPRYFAVLALPLIIMTVLFVAELGVKAPKTQFAVAALCALSLLWNLSTILRAVVHPEYTTANATAEIKQIIEHTSGTSPVVFGPTANTLGLNTGLRTFNAALALSNDQRNESFAHFQPGWVMMDNGAETRKAVEQAIPPERLKLVGSWPWMDNSSRGKMMLYQILPPAK